MKNIFLIIELACVISLNAQVNLDSGLVAYYPFNGNADDVSGNLNHGIVFGATLCDDRYGTANSAYSFDGKNDYISVPNSSTIESPDSAVSIAAWVYINNWFNDDNLNWASICNKPYDQGGQYGLQLVSTGQIEVYLGSAYIWIGSTKFKFQQWFFVAMTWDGDIIKIYLDDDLIATSYFSPTPQRNPGNFEIGRDYPVQIEYLNGKLDELRIYNRALNAEEIRIFADDGPNPINTFQCAGEVLFYPNPATDMITLNLNNVAETYVYVYSVDGKLQMHKTLIDERHIDIANLSGGIYLIEISNSLGIFHGRMIKQ